ncbi:MAG: Holliday junction resolvase RuvX [bacterium]|nr:Holliday junction resolvase RuvX [bacterium]
MEILALDVGTIRVGIARASTRARLPEPLKTVKTEEAIEQLRKIVKENEVKIIVAGLPRNLSGEDTGQTRWVRDWVAQAKAELGVDFYWQDEALTSVQAISNKQKAISNADEHSLAAAIILADFLSTDINNRVLV